MAGYAFLVGTCRSICLAAIRAGVPDLYGSQLRIGDLVVRPGKGSWATISAVRAAAQS
jgi:hypothetical protein